MDLEERIGVVLRAGSVISTMLLALGVVTYLTLPDIAIGWWLVHAGLLIVLATPILRVVVSLVGFVQQGEWPFVFMTVAVLGVLAASALAAFS